MSTLDALAEYAATRYERVAARRAAGARVVGYVGADVPRELIEAAGLLPLRLAPTEVESRSEADAILGPGVDEPTRTILAGLLETRYPIDHLVLCHDTEQTVRLYTSFRALARRRRELPEPAFFDLLHLPTASTAAYNSDRLAELARTLAGWAGAPIDDAELRGAIASANDGRRLLTRLDRARSQGRVTGTQLLAAVAAGTAMTAGEHNQRIAAALGELGSAGMPPRRRVFVLGSANVDAAVYDALEEEHLSVVGEDHDWGAASFDGLVSEDEEPLAALASRYQLGCACGRRHSSDDRAAWSARAAVTAGADVALAWICAGDEARLWGLPAERAAFAASGISLVAHRHRAPSLGHEARAELVGAVLAA
jgi:benzoyl-CoA reductase/2-hydroxyglutaryl-CoA dehydratase subunit BcrC/BadD/HgdB